MRTRERERAEKEVKRKPKIVDENDDEEKLKSDTCQM